MKMSRGADIIFGRHSVAALLERDPSGISEIWLLDGRKGNVHDALRAFAASNAIAVRDATRATLDKVTRGATHQGVAVRYRPSRPEAQGSMEEVLESLEDDALLLALDDVQDPHNLGACLRSADAVGVAAVILPRNRSCPITPVVRKVACGAAESLTIVRVANLARTLEQLDAAAVRVVGAAAQASQSLFEAEVDGPTALVLGGEARGLRRLTQERCHSLVHIPMAGSVESLNVSVATGICLFEYRRKILSA